MHILFQYVASVFDTFATLCTPTPWTECHLQKDDSQSRAEVHKWALVYTNTLNIIKRMCHPVLFPWFRISFLLVFPFDSKQRKKKETSDYHKWEMLMVSSACVCPHISHLPTLFIFVHPCLFRYCGHGSLPCTTSPLWHVPTCSHAGQLHPILLPFYPPATLCSSSNTKNLFLLFGCCPWKKENAPSLVHALWVFLFCLISFIARVFVRACVHACDESSFPCCTIPLVTGKRWDESQTDAHLIASFPKWKKKRKEIKNASGVNRLVFSLYFRSETCFLLHHPAELALFSSSSSFFTRSRKAVSLGATEIMTVHLRRHCK